MQLSAYVNAGMILSLIFEWELLLLFIYFVSIIQAVFGQTGPGNQTVTTSTPSAFGGIASFLVPKLPVGLAGNFSQDKSVGSTEQSKVLQKERHAERPPVEHNWSIPWSNKNVKPPQIFQHELLQNFSINMFCKVWKEPNFFFFLA